MRPIYNKYFQKRGLIIVLLLGLQLAFNYSGYAQNTELRIIDLSISSKAFYSLNEQMEISQKDTLMIGFKMNKAELASKVIVQIGNKEGRKNILNTEYPVVQDGGKYYVDTGSNRYQIQGYRTYFEIPVNRPEINDFFYIKISVEDHSGLVTPELKYKLRY